MTAARLHTSPNALAPHYSRFRVGHRLLLTGHSHQAWPDVGLAAQQQAWLDAADLADRKWGRVGDVADRVRARWSALLHDRGGIVALGQNTHELVSRFLSALPLWGRHARPRLVTTSGEFHTIRRQLARLGEVAGVELVKVEAYPAATLAERLAAAVDARTSAVLVSSVLFETSAIVPDLSAVAAACVRDGAELLVDAYHHVGVVPFDVHGMGLSAAFVLGGGYKYCQLGEGNCFMRVPPDCHLRPVLTGWFSEFGALAAATAPGEVRYGEGATRWAGATYDPVSHYRAVAVFDFFEAQGLTPALLREISRHQTALIVEQLHGLDLPATVGSVEPLTPDERAGFVSVRTPHAQRLVEALLAAGVHSDARGEFLRLGPAPYVSDSQLDEAVDRLARLATALPH